MLGSDNDSDSGRAGSTTPAELHDNGTPTEPTDTPSRPAESVLVAEESFQRGPGPFGVGDYRSTTAS